MTTTFYYFVLPNTISVLFCVLFLVFSIIKFRNKSYKEKMIPIKVLYVLLLALEFIKIYYHISSGGRYHTGRFPIIYCSMVLYLYPIIFCAKQDSILSRVALALSILPAIVFPAVYLFYVPSYSLTFVTNTFLFHMHSRFYHFCMFAVALYLLCVRMYDFRFKDFLPATLTAGVYISCCTVLSIFIGADVALFGPHGEYLEWFYNIFGYAVGNVLLLVVVFIIGLIIYSAVYGLKKFFKYYKTKKPAIKDGR